MSQEAFDPCRFLAPVRELAQQAGKKILEIYDTDFAVEAKDDKSPLTAADMASHDTIVAGLKALAPDIPVRRRRMRTFRSRNAGSGGATGSSTRWTAPRSSSSATASSPSISR